LRFGYTFAKKERQMIRRLKDAALSKGSRTAVNSLMKEYGRMLKLDLDSARKCISMEVMLEGEKEPLHIDISRYELTEEEGRHTLKVYGIKTSRTWINTFAAAYLEGKAFEIPAEYARLLKVVV
jgi:hypothetical protein